MDPYTSPALSGAARGKVSVPATLMIVIAVLFGLFQVFGILMNVVGTGASVMGAVPEEQMLMQFMSGTFGIIMGIVSLIVTAFIIFGAVKMKNLQSYPLAVAAAILICVPFLSPCCLFGLPVGIWALVVLFDDQVKASFH